MIAWALGYPEGSWGRHMAAGPLSREPERSRWVSTGDAADEVSGLGGQHPTDRTGRGVTAPVTPAVWRRRLRTLVVLSDVTAVLV